jgi:hypothetical protein
MAITNKNLGTFYYRQPAGANRLPEPAKRIDQYLATLKQSRNRTAKRPISTWQQEIDRKIQSDLRQMELERMRDLMERERRSDVAAREDRQRALDEQFERETNWRRLMQKASLANKVGKFGAGWGLGDDAWADRLGVEMGYLKPWERKFQMRAGGK